MLHPLSVWSQRYGKFAPLVIAAQARSTWKGAEYFRLCYLGGESWREDRAARSAYPRCPHDRPTVLLRDGEPVCSCEVSK
jgi:hypothetical protein